MNSIKVFVNEGIPADGFRIEVFNQYGLRLYVGEFQFRVNASQIREHAIEALQDIEDAVIFKWDRVPVAMPYAGDILTKVAAHYHVPLSEVMVLAGYSVYGDSVSAEKLALFRKAYLEA